LVTPAELGGAPLGAASLGIWLPGRMSVGSAQIGTLVSAEAARQGPFVNAAEGKRKFKGADVELTEIH
jgi:hypothetical protein